LHKAAQNKASEAVVRALLAAYPDAAKAKDNVRRRRLSCASRALACVLVACAARIGRPHTRTPVPSLTRRVAAERSMGASRCTLPLLSMRRRRL